MLVSAYINSAILVVSVLHILADNNCVCTSFVAYFISIPFLMPISELDTAATVSSNSNLAIDNLKKTNATMEVRKVMASYWKEHSNDASLEEMMLDNNAAVIADEETSEVIRMLPPFEGKKVVELGAGIGRFTQHLAPLASKVTAVDFMETFIDKNRQNNGHFETVDFLVADVTKLHMDNECADLVFSNWLFMYLEDSEVYNCFEKILSWLKPQGHFFIRESCFHRSGSKQRGDNPTKYRHPLAYNNLIKSVFQPVQNTDGLMNGYTFEIIFAKPSRTYIKFKENGNQICWLLRKVPQKRSCRNYHKHEVSLDSYFTESNIAKLERLFGQDFLSTGGLDTTKSLFEKLNIQRDDKILDVGCGLGGTAFHISSTYGADVIAIDRSETMIALALDKAYNKNIKNVVFDIGNVEHTDIYGDHSFDVIYSRDVLMYVENKEIVLKKFMKWLKPGGRLLITDYCCDRKKFHTDDFQSFLLENSYSLVSLHHYQHLLNKIGFITDNIEDISPWFCEVLKQELHGLEIRKDSFIAEFGNQQYKDHLNTWKNKLREVEKKELKWALIMAQKPSDVLTDELLEH